MSETQSFRIGKSWLQGAARSLSPVLNIPNKSRGAASASGVSSQDVVPGAGVGEIEPHGKLNAHRPRTCQ